MKDKEIQVKDKDKDIQILKDIVMAFGISGFEDEVREKIKEKVHSVSFKEDDIGNLYATVGDGGKKIAIITHMDELGFVITQIEKNGYLRFKPVGGWDVRSVYNRVVEIKVPQGYAYGVVGLKPPHLSNKDDMEKLLRWEDLYIDVGVESEDEVKKLGIVPIVPARLKKDFMILNDSIVVSRGIDNRAGCTISVLLLDYFIKNTPPNKITFVWSVQEETGLRGASGFVSKNKFDEVYVIDTVSAGNLPWNMLYQSPARMGGGPVIRLVDNRGVASVKLRNFVKKIAEKNGIEIQEVATGGTTDAAVAFEYGFKSLAICLPIKYTHSPVEMLSINDFRKTFDLMTKIIEEER